VNQHNKPGDKPVLNAESFQRLLAAAYLLQAQKESPPVPSTGRGRTIPFDAAATVLKWPPSMPAREPHGFPHLDLMLSHLGPRTISTNLPEGSVSLVHPRATPTETSIASEMTDAQQASAGPAVVAARAVPKESRRHSGGLLFWRTVDAIAIATIFVALVGASIHRLSAAADPASLPAETPEQRGVSQPSDPTAKVPPSSQPSVMVQDSDQSLDSADADIVADTVVQYGADVTMWSGNLHKAGLDRLGRPPSRR
jgi:hypothetical protein